MATTSIRRPIMLSLLLAGGLVATSSRAEGLPWLSQHVSSDRLPRPVGVGFTLYSQTQDFAISRLSFDLPGIPQDIGGDLAVKNNIQELNLKIDAWLFPFLNVFGIFGELDGTTKVDLRGAELQLPFSGITIDYDGQVYGGGVTVAGGSERFFASLTAVYTESDIGGDFDTQVEALVVMPRAGIHAGRVSAWLGAMYQEADESHAGSITLPFVGQISFAVGLQEKDPWNLLMGMSAGLTDRWYLEIEGGAGDRTSASLGLTYRF